MNHDFLYGVFLGMLVMLFVIRFKKLQADVKQTLTSLDFCEGAVKELYRHVNGEVKHG